MGKARRRGITMLVKDETKFCWVDGETAGEPQDSVKDAIADYLEYISYFDDVARDCDIEWVRVGHPYYLHSNRGWGAYY